MSRRSNTRRQFVPTQRQIGRAKCMIEGIFSNQGYLTFEKGEDLVFTLHSLSRRPRDLGRNRYEQLNTLNRALSQLVTSGKVVVDHQHKVAGTKASSRKRVKTDRYGPSNARSCDQRFQVATAS